ncbi:MAG: helix-turn-helix domain-containing protein [Lentisphaerae bacterium]|nr:helix-turn-helix domain-containing protein [Lentisphaerota bacterium]
MANIQQLLNEEIRRLARKEVISVEKELKSQLVELRKTVSELKNRIKTLEKNQTSAPGKTMLEPANAEDDKLKSVRVTPERIIAWRTKLGLKRAGYAKLLDVSPLSVSHWESGKTVPREAQKRRIAELRDMGKRELKILCQAKGVKLNKSADE